MLARDLRTMRQEKEILLMTHIVLGYPNFDDCLRVIEGMVEVGVDLMELQIPFSEESAQFPRWRGAGRPGLSRSWRTPGQTLRTPCCSTKPLSGARGPISM